MSASLDALPPEARAFVQREIDQGNRLLDVMQPPPEVPASTYVMMAEPLRQAATSPDQPGASFGQLANGLPAVMVLGAQPYEHDPPPAPEPVDPDHPPPLQRWRRSRAITYEQWHEGIGYDLGAIDEASPPQRELIIEDLLENGLNDWRDIEAMAHIGGRVARRALRRCWREGGIEQRMAMLRHAADYIGDAQRTAALVQALREAPLRDGLSVCLDELGAQHAAGEAMAPAVMQALWDALDRPDAEVTVNVAALLAYLHGLADEPFDWDQRPFFLRFGSHDGAERAVAQAELRRRCGR